MLFSAGAMKCTALAGRKPVIAELVEVQGLYIYIHTVLLATCNICLEPCMFKVNGSQ